MVLSALVVVLTTTEEVVGAAEVVGASVEVESMEVLVMYTVVEVVSSSEEVVGTAVVVGSAVVVSATVVAVLVMSFSVLRPLSTPYAAAHSARSIESGQHQVWALVS